MGGTPCASRTGVGPLPLPRGLRPTPVVASSRARSYVNVVCDPLMCGISDISEDPFFMPYV
ncbi:hypothetical protein PanWU01x14_350610, partial [Parasponia andersonii]